MKIPVKDELREGDPCVICQTVKRSLDQLIIDLPQIIGNSATDETFAAPDDIEHVMSAVIRWFMQQALAHTDGNVEKVVGIVQGCLNEPQNNRLVAKHLEEVQLQYQSPAGPVH